MKTSPKAQGTRTETATVNTAQNLGLQAERLPEQGSNDRGDIRIYTNTEWVGEVKNRERLNIHQTLDKAITKAGTPDTFVVWKRLTRNPGNTRRHQDGPIIVALTLDRFLALLKETTT
jgi:hypothetical protein